MCELTKNKFIHKAAIYLPTNFSNLLIFVSDSFGLGFGTAALTRSSRGGGWRFAAGGTDTGGYTGGVILQIKTAI